MPIFLFCLEKPTTRLTVMNIIESQTILGPANKRYIDHFAKLSGGGGVHHVPQCKVLILISVYWYLMNLANWVPKLISQTPYKSQCQWQFADTLNISHYSIQMFYIAPRFASDWLSLRAILVQIIKTEL